MEQRGRKGAESLNVLSFVPGQRPAPPAHLTGSQADLWRAIVATKPADWFAADTFPLLEAYIVGFGIAATLKVQLDEFNPQWLTTDEGVERFDSLTKMYQRQSAALASLATKMRISQQSRYDAKTASTAAKGAGKGGARPWEAPGKG